MFFLGKDAAGLFGWYETGGLEALAERRAYQPQIGLELRLPIVAEFEARPAQTMKEAAEQIVILIGVRRSPDQVRRYLTRLGLTRRKTDQLPAKADP